MTALIASLVLAAAPPLVQLESYTLSNGLTVILAPDGRLPTVAVDLWYHVGAANEAPGRSGFARFAEPNVGRIRILRLSCFRET